MRIISGAASGNTERVSLDYIQINNCGFCEVDDFDMTTNRPSGRADYQLIYVWRGQVRCELPEGPRALGEGEVIVYRPWERQAYTYLCAQKTQVYWLHFTGQGIPSLRGNGKGDLYVTVTVEIPKRLSEKQKNLLRQFDGTVTGQEYEQKKSFFDRVKEAFGGNS